MKTLEEKLAELPAERREKVEAGAATLIQEERARRKLEEARKLIPESLQQTFSIDKGFAADIERSCNFYLSVLADHVEAMGGSFDFDVQFPDASIRFKRLTDVFDLEAEEDGPPDDGKELHVKSDKRQLAITSDVASWRALLVFVLGANDLDQRSRQKVMALIETIHMQLSRI